MTNVLRVSNLILGPALVIVSLVVGLVTRSIFVKPLKKYVVPVVRKK